MLCCFGTSPEAELVSNYKHATEIEDALIEIDKLQTGDILLFYLKGIPACISRRGLSTKWDHVGFVVRRNGYSRALAEGEVVPFDQTRSKRPCKPSYCTCYSKSTGDEVELLESTASGVHVYSLEERILRAREVYKVVAVRHLENFKRTEKIQGRIETFIKRVRGRAYQYLNLQTLKMVAHRGLPDTSHAENSYAEKQKGKRNTSFNTPVNINKKLMCSELAAAALMSIGVLKRTNMESHDFGPTTFSSLDSHDLINALTHGDARFTKEYVFHYPGGPYNEALSKLKILMDQSIFAGSSLFDQMYRVTRQVTKNASKHMRRRMTRFLTSSNLKVVPDIEDSSYSIERSRKKALPADAERHFSTREAMNIVGSSRSTLSAFSTSRLPSFSDALRKLSLHPSATAPN